MWGGRRHGGNVPGILQERRSSERKRSWRDATLYQCTWKLHVLITFCKWSSKQWMLHRRSENFFSSLFFYNLMPMPQSFVTSWLRALSRPVRLNKRSARSEFDMWSRDVMSPTSVPECWTIYHLKSSLCVNVTWKIFVSAVVQETLGP